ncbi:hypothetical protein NKG94_13045 [Micromonospora sp. M12]
MPPWDSPTVTGGEGHVTTTRAGRRPRHRAGDPRRTRRHAHRPGGTARFGTAVARVLAGLALR